MAFPGPTLLAQSVVSEIFTGALYGLLGMALSLSWGLLHQINLAHFYAKLTCQDASLLAFMQASPLADLDDDELHFERDTSLTRDERRATHRT